MTWISYAVLAFRRFKIDVRSCSMLLRIAVQIHHIIGLADMIFLKQRFSINPLLRGSNPLFLFYKFQRLVKYYFGRIIVHLASLGTKET